MIDNPPSANATPRRKWPRRLGRGLLLYVVVPYLAVLAVFTVLQRRFIYQPTRSTSLQTADFGLSSAEASDVMVETDDGLILRGWLLSAGSGVTSDPTSDEGTAADRLAIYFSGNAGHRGYRVPDFNEFARHGFDVLVFDYRGYGDNPGSPSQRTMQADARAIWRFAVEQLGADPGRIVLYGESMGGAVATHLAAELSEESQPPAALITNATFASLSGTVQWHYPWFPFHFLLWDRWPSVERMPHVTCPVLMFHGTRDDIVPLVQGRELFSAARPESPSGIPKRFIELPNSGHNDIPVATLKNELEALVSAVFDTRPVDD